MLYRSCIYRINRPESRRFLILGNPSCFKKYSDVTVLVGNTAFLPCDIKGSVDVTYEWRKVQDKNLRSLGLRFNPTNKGLIIYNATKEDEGKYQVELKDKHVYYSSIKLHIKGIFDVNYFLIINFL